MHSKVYFTPLITSNSLVEIYSSLERILTGKVAVKMSTGEPPASNYLRPELIGDLVQQLGGTIVECNTAYGGKRHLTEDHERVIKDHKLNTITDVHILDSDSDEALIVRDPFQIVYNYVGSGMFDYDSMLVLSHFKGHPMAGYGGAIKNIAIGLASARGKSYIHTAGRSMIGIEGDTDSFLESMVDAASTIVDHFKDKIVYINVLNNISIDCDCNGHPAEPEIPDIGIAASYDPVALDQACIDMCYYAPGSDSLMNRIFEMHGLHTLECAEEIRLGSRDYELVEI